MQRQFLAKFTVAVLALAIAGPAAAQTFRSDTTTPSTTANKAKPAPANAGTWIGSAQQLGKSGSFPVKVVITATGAASEYPDQDCSGKLTRIASSGSYTLYAEKITVGAYDQARGSGCLDGIVTLRKSGDKMLFGWAGSIDDQMITVAGALESGPSTAARPSNPARPSRP